MENLTGKIENHNGVQRLILAGHLNENAGSFLQGVIPKLEAQVVVNFCDVKSINSFGVHTWIGFLGKISQGRTLAFEECTPEIVAQINMMPLFKRDAVIESVYASYTCPSCGHEERVLFMRGKNMPTSPQDVPGSVSCSSCGKSTEMDQEFSDFFMFLEL